MGVDAEMFVRIKGRDNWLDEKQVKHLAYRLGADFGYDSFGGQAMSIVEPFKDTYDELPHLVGKVVILQDGPDEVAADDEQFLKLSLWARYYGPSYERGPWPFLRTLISWLDANIPHGTVWYGGDSSGVCAEHMTAARVAEIDRHFFASGHAPYRRYRSGGFCGTSAPDCPKCEVKMYSTGGSNQYDFWYCDGCGAKASKHVDGREAWAPTPRHGFPCWDQSGTLIQREGDL